jgi:hypothetical protein
MRLTRRLFGTGLLGLGAGLGLGLGTRALAERPTGARLAEALNRRLVTNPAGARFDVPAFAATPESAGIRMVADIRLDWTPGMRARRFAGAGADEAAAWSALLAAAVTEFAGTVPGFDGAGPVA